MPFTVTLDFVEAFDSQIETECCPQLGVYLIFFPFEFSKIPAISHSIQKKGVCIFAHVAQQ